MKIECKMRIYKKVLCIALILVVALSAFFMASCTKEDKPEANETENTVRAADPMTEEEMEADDTDGCIEDSEDLLN